MFFVLELYTDDGFCTTNRSIHNFSYHLLLCFFFDKLFSVFTFFTFACFLINSSALLRLVYSTGLFLNSSMLGDSYLYICRCLLLILRFLNLVCCVETCFQCFCYWMTWVSEYSLCACLGLLINTSSDNKNFILIESSCCWYSYLETSDLLFYHFTFAFLLVDISRLLFL